MNPAERIRRATLKSIKERNRTIKEASTEVKAAYEQALKAIQQKIHTLESNGRIELNHLHDVLNAVNVQLKELNRARDGMLYRQMDTAALAASKVFTPQVFAVNHQAVAFVRGFTGADGLQLSDRLWRISQGTSDRISEHIQHAIITGESSHQAAIRSLKETGEIPAETQIGLNRASASSLNQSIADLMTGEGGSYYQAERLFRTELARAHGEAYMAQAFDVEGVAGVRFCLSPNHPKKDICDEHALADLYGLGPGVYPDRESCPWPAHPNTLSYVEAVFQDATEAVKEEGFKQITDLDELIRKGHAISEELLQGRSNEFLFTVHERLNQVRPAQKGAKFAGRGKGVDLVSAASRLFPDSWNAYSDQVGKLYVRYNMQRGGHWQADRDYGFVAVEGIGMLKKVKKGSSYINAGRFDTAVHEYVHRLQHTVPGLDDLFQSIHERRTKGAPKKSLRALTGNHGYSYDEVSQEDHYINPYQGRVYGPDHGYRGKHGALEVMTMAFEHVLSANPHKAYKLADHDREMFDLVIGALFHYDP